MSAIGDIIQREALWGTDQGQLDRKKRDGARTLEAGDAKIYARSLYVRGGSLYFIGKVGLKKSLYIVSDKPVKGPFTGTASREGALHLLTAELTVENARALKETFPFTAPISLRDKKTTIGCGDRLGIATPGHLRAVSQFDVYPVLAQQSIRELTLTKRDFPMVTRDVAFMVFQEGYERGYGADGDHLKTMKDIDLALEAGMPMITLDLTEVMHPEPAGWSQEKIESEFERLDDATTQTVLDRYAGRTFTFGSSSLVFDELEVKKCTLMYWTMLDFTREVDRHLKEHRGDQYDLEVSIDETTAPTIPAHHLFIARELEAREVAVNSLAPRFIGEFQKGIDYIGNVAEFDAQFKLHCDIAHAFGSYKVSIHSGSDKFSVYPSIGKLTELRLHLKTAGTSWLEAVRVISQKNPALFRTMLRKAFDYFPEATKLYYITADVSSIRDASTVPDEELPSYLDNKDSRQLIHITYGGLLNDPEIRPAFFETLSRFEDAHDEAVAKHIAKHIELLGVPRR